MHTVLGRFVPVLKNAVWPFSVSLLLFFLLYAATFATSNPLCCADDAYFAVVSKNLASGLGYLSTINVRGNDFDYGGVLFDPGISTGAPSILPVAIVIYLFGPLAPVPGLVHIALYAVLVAAMAFKVRAVSGKVVAGGILTLFVLLIVSTSAYHFEQWYAQLGEVLAAMLVIMGAAVLGMSPSGYRAYFIAGLFMGGAVLTKQLAALYFAGAYLVILYRVLRAPCTKRAFEFKFSLIFFIGGCVPILSFELWKMSVLSLASWLENWQIFYHLLLQNGVGKGHHSSFSQLLLERLDSVQQRFFISWYALILALIVYPFLLLSLPDKLKRFSIFLVFGSVLNVVYWVGWSVGWPRYAYMAIIMGALLVSIAQVAGKGRISRILMALSIVMVVFSGVPKINWHFPAKASLNSNAHDAQIVASYIELKHQEESVQTQWWAHVAALEYLSSTPHRYSLWNEPRNRLISKRLLITDSRFLVKDDASFMAFLTNSCGIELAYGIYTLYSCK